MAGRADKGGMIANLQLLRGIAATMIVGVHLRPMLGPAGVDAHSFPFLFAGVDIFFVISGFIMVHVTARRGASPAAFLTDRAIRIVPVYWLFTLVLFAVACALPGLGTTPPGAGALARSMAFIPYGDPPQWPPLVYVGWSLNLEIYFYLIFALGMALGRIWPVRLVLTAGLIGVPVIVAQGAAPTSLWQFYGAPIVLEFVIGMAIGHWRAQVERMPHALGAGLVLLGTVLVPLAPLVLPHAGTFERFAMPAALLVTGLVACEARGLRARGPLVLGWGAISYVLYIAHPLVISAFNNVQERVPALQSGGASILLAAVALLASVTVAWVVHRLFERPVSRQLKAWLSRPARVSAKRG